MNIKTAALCLSVYLTLSLTVLGQTLIIEARPTISDNQFVQSGEDYYLLSEIEDIKTKSTQFDRVSSNEAQYQDFYFIRPNGYVECQIDIPVCGNYNIFTRLYQHGNTGPKAEVYVNGSCKNEISGNKTWAKTSVYLEAGICTIRYKESGSGSTEWPLRMVGLDAAAVTNDLDWNPPECLSTHPYNGNQYWWERPSNEVDQIQVTAGSKTAEFDGSWGYTDILMIDDSGQYQATIDDLSVAGDSLAGEDLSAANVSSDTQKRMHDTAVLAERDNNRISPNYDLIKDEVSVSVPEEESGYIKIKRFNNTTIRQMPEGQYVWDGRLENEIYSDFAQKNGYILEFTPVSGGSRSLLSCVYSDPSVVSMVSPRCLEFSPNDDDVYDTAQVNLNTQSGFNFNSSDSVVVRNSSGETVRNLPKTDPIQWDGKDNSGSICTAQTYTIEILDNSGQLRAGSKINLLDLPPTGQEPHDQGDFYVLGMWLGFNSTQASDLDNLVSMNCNAFRHPHSGTVQYGATRQASSWWPAVESRNLKVLVNLYEVVEAIIDLPMAPSEPRLEDLLGPYVNPVKNKSSLLGYELLDEPSYEPEMGYRLRAIQQVLHRLDPDHPSVPVLIGRDSRISGYTSDMKPHQLLLDVYPFNQGTQPGDLRDIWGYQGIDMLEYMDWAMDFVEPRGVKTWIIHQSHNFLDSLREPTPEEIRLQVWLGLSRAISGSFFFIYETQQDWTGIEDNPPIKSAVSDVYGRLKQPEVYNVLPELSKDDFAISISGGGNPYGYSNGEAAALQAENKKYIIAVNHDCTSSSEITINSADYPSAKLKDLESSVEYNMGEVISFPAGDGKIFEIITQDQTPPDTPAGVTVNDITESQLSLSWDLPQDSAPATGYRIYDGSGSLLADIGAEDFFLDGLSSGQSYCFYVKAYNQFGESIPSETVCGQTFNSEPPSSPDNVKIAGCGASQIEIEWDLSQDNVAVQNYDLFSDGQLIDTIEGSSYLMLDCQPSTRYEFQLRARDVDGGLSSLTPPVCVITCQDDPVPANLQGYWKFDDHTTASIPDSSLYNRNGTGYNVLSAPGYLDNSLQFNGSDSKVMIDSFGIDGNQLTIAAWVKASGFNFAGDNRILSKASGFSEQDHFWMLSTTRVGGEYFLRFRLKTNDTTTTLQGVSQQIPIDQWVHVCAVYDGSTMRIYKNGCADSQTALKYGCIDNGNSVDVAIGANPDGSSVWQGSIDDLRIYSAALSQTQIQEVMANNEPLEGEPSAEPCGRIEDVNCDGIVDMSDFVYIHRYWLRDAFKGHGDFVEDDHVDFNDLVQFMSSWLYQGS
ncbi:Chitinase A1 precursor [Sedimentisphaera salicampi]|uniref:Chitinase A1 n=1 Tax=Sedimentisphaera salicampi TaxID=1941349 RepID=A0A1W6LLP3_9BACT|nr:Chitinase A1 precursor [Sedimentisphaera salicampi]